MKESKKITKWLDSRKENWFWGWIWGNSLFDACIHEDKDGSEAFDEGFDLAIQAAGKSVYGYRAERSDVSIYFIGDEDVILLKLQTAFEIEKKKQMDQPLGRP